MSEKTQSDSNVYNLDRLRREREQEELIQQHLLDELRTDHQQSPKLKPASRKVVAFPALEGVDRLLPPKRQSRWSLRSPEASRPAESLTLRDLHQQVLQIDAGTPIPDTSALWKHRFRSTMPSMYK